MFACRARASAPDRELLLITTHGSAASVSRLTGIDNSLHIRPGVRGEKPQF